MVTRGTKSQAPSGTPHRERVVGRLPGVDTSVYTNLFVGTVLSMSWQLALAVIVPIVGGYTLDQHFASSPLLTLLGLVLAAAATVAVLWQTVRRANARVAELQKRGR